VLRHFSANFTALDSMSASFFSVLTRPCGEPSLPPHTELTQLQAWLLQNQAADLPAVGFLLDVVHDIVSRGSITADDRADLQLEIERVLPVTERGFARDMREAAAAANEWKDESEPRISRGDLKQMAEDAQDAPPDGDPDGDTPPSGRYWRNDPMTDAQKGFIKSLGGRIRAGATKGEASDLISSLLGEKPVSSRHLMILRFWALENKAFEGPRAVGEWLDTFYEEDPDRRAAWELFKGESEDDGLQEDPSRVPLGVGPEYLARVKAGGQAAVPRFRPNTGADSQRASGDGSRMREWILDHPPSLCRRTRETRAGRRREGRSLRVGRTRWGEEKRKSRRT